MQGCRQGRSEQWRSERWRGHQTPELYDVFKVTT
jgi:hypothetical protein